MTLVRHQASYHRRRSFASVEWWRVREDWFKSCKPGSGNYAACNTPYGGATSRVNEMRPREPQTLRSGIGPVLARWPRRWPNLEPALWHLWKHGKSRWISWFEKRCLRTSVIPVTKAGCMLGKRLRRWLNIQPALVRSLAWEAGVNSRVGWSPTSKTPGGVIESGIMVPWVRPCTHRRLPSRHHFGHGWAARVPKVTAAPPSNPLPVFVHAQCWLNGGAPLYVSGFNDPFDPCMFAAYWRLDDLFSFFPVLMQRRYPCT